MIKGHIRASQNPINYPAQKTFLEAQGCARRAPGEGGEEQGRRRRPRSLPRLGPEELQVESCEHTFSGLSESGAERSGLGISRARPVVLWAGRGVHQDAVLAVFLDLQQTPGLKDTALQRLTVKQLELQTPSLEESRWQQTPIPKRESPNGSNRFVAGMP